MKKIVYLKSIIDPIKVFYSRIKFTRADNISTETTKWIRQIEQRLSNFFISKETKLPRLVSAELSIPSILPTEN